MNLKDLRKDDVKPGNKEAVSYIDSLFEDTRSKFLKLHRDWYVNERFVRGDHWIIFNKTLNKIQTIPIQDGEIRRTVNKIRSQIRGVKNFIKRSQPRWEVHPDDATDEALEEAKKLNKILQYIYRTLQFPLILTETIVSGLKFSIGIVEGGIIKENGKQKIKFWHDDTFDILIDPFATEIQNARYIFKAFKKPLTSVNNNPDYTINGTLTGDTDDGVSTYKELLENEKYGKDSSRNSGDLESILVKELWIKWEEEGKVKLKVLTVAGDQLIRTYEPKYRRFPFFIYNPEVEPGAIYSDPWIKDLISLNKSLDKNTSQTEAYIQRMLAGKYLIKQGVEVSSITDKGAEYIYYKGSVPPSQQNLQPLPAAPFTHSNNLERWIEELGGAREASLGRVPGGIQSGKALEALQSADAGTVAEPIENLAKLLERMSEFSLELIEDFTIASEEIVEEGEKIKFIGGGAKGNIPDGTMRVTAKKVKVMIVPEIAYSEEAKFDRLIRLAEAQLIDPETILDKLSISNVSQIIERMKNKKQEDFKEEITKQRESHRTGGEGPEDTADLADQENMQMAAGQPVPPTPQALWTPEHTELHMAFIQENQDAYKQQKELFDEHISQEEQYGGGQPQEQPQEQPQQPQV